MTITNGPNGATAEWLRKMIEIETESEYAPDGPVSTVPHCPLQEATARSHPCVAEADEDHEFRPLEGVARPVLEDCDECRPDFVSFLLQRQAY